MSVASERLLPGGSERIHHLDWLRAMCIGAGVFLCADQVFGVEWPPPYIRLDTVMYEVFAVHNPYHEVLHQSQPGWRNGYSGRYIMVGRQLVAPLLFWISGYALCLSKAKALSSIGKVALVTVIGMLANVLVWSVGPRDEKCGWYAAEHDLKDYCAEKGRLMNFGIGTGHGMIYSVVFQFWFTLLLAIFLAQLHPLCEGLRELQMRSEGLRWAGSCRVAFNLAAYFGLSTLVYVGFLLGWSTSPERNRAQSCISLALFELLYLGALVCAVMVHPDYPKLGRSIQYLAGLLAVIQFCVPQLEVTSSIDGAMVVYFHIFKHFFSLGFVMALKRKQTMEVMSRYFPIMLFVLIMFAGTTNYYEAGVPIYPYFPRAIDRFIWGTSGVLHIFFQDRMGSWAADKGLLLSLPPCVGAGALLSYLFQVPAMALFAPFAGSSGAVGITICTLSAGYMIAALIELRKKRLAPVRS